MRLSLDVLMLSLMVLFISSLIPVFGQPIANVIMWGIAGLQIGRTANAVTGWIYDKYFKEANE